MLAVNSATPGFSGYRLALGVASSHMVISEPVPDVIEEIGWSGGENIHDCRTLLHYFRTTNDGRIALGWGGGRMGVGGKHSDRLDIDADAARHAAAGLRRFFPQLEKRELTHAWGGPIDVSPTHLPIFGSKGKIHHGFGFTGNGVGPTYLGGEILARLALDRRDAITGLAIVEPDRKLMPPEPFRWLGGTVIRAALVRRDAANDGGTSTGSGDRLRRLTAPAPRPPAAPLTVRERVEALEHVLESRAGVDLLRRTTSAAGGQARARRKTDRQSREELRRQTRRLLARRDLVHLGHVPARLGGDALQHARCVVDEIGVAAAEVVQHELEDAVRVRGAERLREDRRLALVERGRGHLDRRRGTDLVADDPKLEARRVEARNLRRPLARQVDHRRPGNPRWRPRDRAVDGVESRGGERCSRPRAAVVGEIAFRSATSGRAPVRPAAAAISPATSTRDAGRHDREHDRRFTNDLVERRQQLEPSREPPCPLAPTRDRCDDASAAGRKHAPDRSSPSHQD